MYVKVPKEFMGVIFWDICWVVHKPFVGMVKFKFPAHFPVDQLIIIIIIIIITHSLELFTAALADGFSLESE